MHINVQYFAEYKWRVNTGMTTLEAGGERERK